MKSLARLAVLLLAAAAPALAANVLVVYDGPRGASEAFKTARTIEGLLGHFRTAPPVLLPLGEYAPGAALEADFVFVTFEEDPEDLPPAFLRDLAATRAVVTWLGLHAGQLAQAAPGRWSFRAEEWEERPDWTISYKDEDFPKEDAGLTPLRLDPERPAAVLATVRDATGRTLPYAVHDDNLWLFADSPFSYAMEGGRYLVFADLLHDILGQDHPAARRALVRIEDVNAWSDPGALESIGSFLRGRRVPFQVAVIPISIDPGEQAQATLSEAPAVVRALRGMVERGGSVVLHGVTHQSRGVSGDDYEFWDDIAGVPIPHESADWVDQRLRRGLNECFRNGLYPLAWETPHYSASQDDYKAFARYFGVLYDRVMAAELSGTQQLFPYPCRLPGVDALVVPENCGYVEVEKPDPGPVLAAARRTRVVRDAVASFFFHPFVPRKHLRAIVDGMRGQGWEFVSLRDFPCVTRTESHWVSSASGERRVTAANQYVHRVRFAAAGGPSLERYGDRRERGEISGAETLRPGEFDVLEAVDFLPEARPGLWASVRGAVRSLFRGREARPAVPLARALVLSGTEVSDAASNEEASFAFVLRIFGLHPDTREARGLTAESLRPYTLVVVPAAAARAMGDFEANALFGFVEAGGTLVAAERTAFAERLGIAFDPKPVRVSSVHDLSFPVRDLQWSPPAEVYAPDAPNVSVVTRDAASEAPVAIVVPRGRGRVFFLAAAFDPFTRFGTSRYAYFPLHLRSTLGVGFNVRRNTLEFYCDPGFHPTASREKLVEQWRDSGVRVIYLAAWHFYASYEFDYAGFIDLCHRNGIAVYAWFEFPQVTPRFWDEHPEWREKTLGGGDSRSSWRLQMNLANPAARAAALAFFGGLVRKHDWDGIVLAEMSFDTNKGAADPSKFTPMNADAREAFRRESGFDPIDLFDPRSPRFFRADPAAFQAFLEFRRRLTVGLHEDFLEEAERAKADKGRDLEVVVTTLDSVLHPEIVEECGVDSRDIAALMARFPFTLQVEDPARSWAGAPTRYRDLAAAYAGLGIDPKRLMFDINCIARDVSATRLPSSLPTGTELAATVFYASFSSGRAAVYSEFTVPPFDMDILPYVMGADVDIRRRGDAYIVDAGEPVTLTVNRPELRPELNGAPWPFYGPRGISLPSGRSTLRFAPAGWLETRGLAPRMSFGGDVERLERRAGDYVLTYRAPFPVPIEFNRPPSGLRLDGAAAPVPKDGGDLVLPKGRHVLEIRPESTPSRAVGVVGYLSSSVFFWAGLLSIPLLLAIYIHAKVKG